MTQPPHPAPAAPSVVCRDPQPVKNIRALWAVDDDGTLTWLAPRPGRPNVSRNTDAGRVRGALLVVRTGGVDFAAADIAWTLHHGAWPPSPVYVINNQPRDLRADNLTLDPRLSASRSLVCARAARALDQLNAARRGYDLPPLTWADVMPGVPLAASLPPADMY